MLSQEFFTSICGPPLTTNTAVAKDVGIHGHTLSPSYAVKATFKKSSTPTNCLAVSETHIFAAQHEKAYVHVYSRLRGNQEAFVSLPERIRCLALVGNVLVLGSTQGRIFLWEVCTGRLVSTPSCHVQAVSCLASTRHYLLSGSDDSNIHVWPLASLLELDATAEHEPVRTLSNHRAALTSLAVGQGTNLDTSICVSASKDKSCIIWNYHTGTVLRTLLFPSFPLCICLDPTSRAMCVSCEDGSVYLVDFFGHRPLLGPSAEDSASAVQLTSPFGIAPAEAGVASCLALSYDGTVLLSGHPRGQVFQWDIGTGQVPKEIANLNAAITNLTFVSPLPRKQSTMALSIVKPTAQTERNYTFTAQLESDLGDQSRFDGMLNSVGFPQEALEKAMLAFQEPQDGAPGDLDLQKQVDELWHVIRDQQAAQKLTVEQLKAARGSTPA